VLSTFLSAIQTNGSASDIKDSLTQGKNIVRKLFFDPSKTEAVNIVKARLGDVTLSNEDLLFIIDSLSSVFEMDEATFLDSLRMKINEDAKQAVVKKLKEEWRRISGADAPSVWAISNKIPARFVFGEYNEADYFIKAIEQPDTFAPTKLAELLDRLEEIGVAYISDCQKAFLNRIIPRRYAKFDINLASLLDFLQKKYGSQPNNWATNPDINDFIKEQYKNSLAPQVAEKIRNESADELKKKLLKLAETNPELGLLFWE
jgi:hypothetical protein